MRTSVALILILLVSAPFAWANPEPTGPWHSEIDYHPRLLFTDSDLAAIQARLDREPYITVMGRVRGRANGGFTPTPPDPYNASREYSLANIAKSAAFVAWVDQDTAMAERAAQALEAIATDFGSNPLVFVDSDIHIAEAMTGYCYAYDILAGTGMVDPTRVAAIKANLEALFEDWYHRYIDLLAAAADIHTNNHGSKVAAAFAAAGMTFNDHEHANKWFNYGMSKAYDIIFNIQTTDEGVIAEGLYYSNYAAVNHLPVWASYDLLVGADDTLQKRGLCIIGPNCPWNDFEIINPMDHPKQYATSLWLVKARMPDGSPPPVDDANPEGYPGGLVASRLNEPLIAWEWINNHREPMFTVHCSDVAVESVALYDDSVAAAAPGDDFGPHFINDADGFAVFRSGWEQDDSWAMFVAEKGMSRVAGGGHEHSDNLSLLFFARGEYLLLDPGYVRREEHQLVRASEHHNVPTVDGHGPPNFPDLISWNPGIDGYLVDSMTDVAAPFVTGTSEWEDTFVRRSLFFAEDDYLIVIDDLQSSVPHTYGMWWHGQAGGDSGFPFAQNADGATWAPGDAAVDVHVGSSLGDTTASTLINIHSFMWAQQIEHESLHTAAVAQSESGRFISVAVPYDTGETPRAVTWIRDTDVIAARIEGDNTQFVIAQPERALRDFSALDTGSVAVTTSARTMIFDAAADGSSGYAYLDGEGVFRVDGGRIWGFIGTDRVWVEWDGDDWTFDFANPDGQLVTRHLPVTVMKGDGLARVRRVGELLVMRPPEGSHLQVGFAPVGVAE